MLWWRPGQSRLDVPGLVTKRWCLVSRHDGLISDVPVKAVKPGVRSVAPTTDLDWCWSSSERSDPGATGEPGQVHQDIDLIVPDGSCQCLIRLTLDVPVPINTTLEPVGDRILMLDTTIECHVEHIAVVTIDHVGKGGCSRMDSEVSRDVPDPDTTILFFVKSSEIMWSSNCYEWSNDLVVQIPTTSNRIVWRRGVSEISNEYLITPVTQRTWAESDDSIDGLDGVTVPDQLDVDGGEWG